MCCCASPPRPAAERNASCASEDRGAEEAEDLRPERSPPPAPEEDIEALFEVERLVERSKSPFRELALALLAPPPDKPVAGAGGLVSLLRFFPNFFFVVGSGADAGTDADTDADTSARGGCVVELMCFCEWQATQERHQ